MSGKRIKIKVMAREVYETPINGDGFTIYRVSDDLIRVMGQAAAVFFHGRVFGIDADCQLDIGVWAGALGKERPYQIGVPINLHVPGQGSPVSVAVFTARGPFTFATADPLRVDTEPVIIVRRTSGTARKQIEFELYASLDLLG